jgi:acyl-CoA dehydrogenase
MEPNRKPASLPDDLLGLPLFSHHHRVVAAAAQATLDGLAFPAVEGDGAAALRASAAMLGEAGLLGHAVPKDGVPFETTPFCLVREAIAARSVIADLAYVMQALGSLPLSMGGSAALKAEYLPAMRSGRCVAAFALTEPEAGSDVAALTCRAVRHRDVWHLTGEKHLISNAGVADVYTVFARTGDGPKGISAFLVEAKSPGLRAESTIPIAPHPLGRLLFDDVKVPGTHLLGAEGGGLKLALATLARGRPSVGAAACGFARRALEEAISYVRGRRAFGQHLADMQLVQSMVSHSLTELDAARLLVYRAAVAADAAPDERHDRASSEAKWYATEAAQRIIDRSVQMVGGRGVLQDSILGQLYQAIRPLRIYEGASEVQQLVIARALFEEMDRAGK